MSTRTANQHTTLKRRIRRFYDLLNARRFNECYRLIDPRLLEKPGTVTLYQYEQALGEFLERVGSVRVRKVTITGLHLNEPSKLYEGRDFALGKTVWEDAAGMRHELPERWVRDGSGWYTRSTGLLKPVDAGPPEAPPRGVGEAERPAGSHARAGSRKTKTAARTGSRPRKATKPATSKK